ncbi:uncharacterized protein LOC143604797, partial [Bidens hawaiensis]|uniref:uncharacterized protein LOC143604797 n=1 Tax=Bidens hawaiensis TaxID=980011 RepID=UPI00404B33A3
CIGSAFNSKRAMQCPNCRRIKRGRSAGANFQVRNWVAVPHDVVYYRELNVHAAPSNYILSTYFHHPTWGWNCHFIPYNASTYFTKHAILIQVNPPVRSTNAWPPPIY